MRNIIATILHFVIYKGVNGASPILSLCLKSNRIAWRHFEPYVEHDADTNNKSGIMPTIFNLALQSCCRGNINNDFKLEFQTQDDAAAIITNQSIDFIMPIQKDLRSKKYLHNPFVTVVESPGVAFYVIPSPSTGEAILQAITSTWPLILAMFMMVAIAGTLFCLLEMIVSSLYGEEGKPFRERVWEGIWWAFVSMTTVGYGDICPKTKPGKVFSMIWVITGVACCALFTSYITTILTSACLNEALTLHGTEVGVVKGSEEHKFAIKKNSVPKAYQNVDEIVQAFQEKEIKAALIDSYVAAMNQLKLSHYRLQTIIEHVSTNGIVFQNNGIKFASCIRDYILSRQQQVFDIILTKVKPLKMSSTSYAEEKSQNLINTNSAGYYIPVAIVLVVLATLFVAGILWDYLCIKKKILSRRRAYEVTDVFEPDLTLTQWRQNYKEEMAATVRGIHEDIEKLKEKCISLNDRLVAQSRGLASASMF